MSGAVEGTMDLTHGQWTIVEPLIPTSRTGVDARGAMTVRQGSPGSWRVPFR